jgi:hypothetical protein
MEQPLQYKYEDYEEDFDPEDPNDKNKSKAPALTVDFQHQTTPPGSPKQKTQEQEHYEEDFIEASHEPAKEKATPGKKVYENTPNREKMIEQNIKLKTQIYELAKQMD